MVICLWSYPLDIQIVSKVNNSLILHFYRDPKPINVNIFTPPSDIPIKKAREYFFEHSKLVSWVAWESINNQVNRWIVSVMQIGIYVYGELELPTVYAGFNVYITKNPYQLTHGIKQDPIKMGDDIGVRDLKAGYGTMGAFISDKDIIIIYLVMNMY